MMSKFICNQNNKHDTSNQKWTCSTCSFLNASNRNIIPCSNCFGLDSDINLKRAHELYILGVIGKPSVSFIPLKTPFFIYPLSAPIVTHSINYKDNSAMIHFNVELWDNKHIENYHIKSIKVDHFENCIQKVISNKPNSTTIIQNRSPYNHTFALHIKDFKQTFQQFQISAKCYNSPRISPKKECFILLCAPLPNTTAAAADTISKPSNKKRKLDTTMPAIDVGMYSPSQKKYRMTSKHSNTNTLSSNTNNTVRQNNNNNNYNIINGKKTEQTVYKWYSKNDNGQFDAVHDDISKQLSTMSSGETKRILVQSPWMYCLLKKISYNQCTETNQQTGKIRELNRQTGGFCYQADDGLFKQYSDDINQKLYLSNDGQSISFSLTNNAKYEVTLTDGITGKQTNLLTGFVRNVKWFWDKYNPVDIDAIYSPKQLTQDQTAGFCYQASDGLFKPYSDDINRKVLSADIGSSITFSVENDMKYTDTYEVKLTSCDIGTQTNLSTGTVRSVKWMLRFQTIDDPIITKKSNTIDDPIIISDEDEKEEKEEKDEKGVMDDIIEAEFFTKLSPSKYEITEITDISNENSVKIYQAILATKCKEAKLKPYEIEQYLWHGIKANSADVLKKILRNGFDRSYNKVGVYGKGTYFAHDASYSVEHEYCGKDDKDIYFILYCRVITGDYVNGKQNMKTIPTKPDGQEYDSLVDNKDKPRIFVSWRDYHAIPYYLVKFRKCTNKLIIDLTC